MGARQPASAAVNWAKSRALSTARNAARSGEGTLPIQSTATVWPAVVITGPCTVMSTVRWRVAPPRTGIV